MADLALQRKNMVESQVRPSDVTDRRIVSAMLTVPREAFVPEVKRQLAYMDGDIALTAAPPGQAPRALLAPRVFAKLIDAARIGAGDTVLDVGTGCGYSAAIISRLASSVVALERDAVLATFAAAALASQSIERASVVQGDLASGWAQAAPYDVIVVEGAMSVEPVSLLAQLKEGGRLAGIVKDGKTSRAVVWQRRGASCDAREVFAAAANVLPGFERQQVFSL